MASTPNEFSEGEKILCFHGPLIYEAKCLKHRYNDKEQRHEYMVHYQGWNKNWDEWVPETRVLKFNEASLAKQNDLQLSQKESRCKRSKGSPKIVKTGKEAKSSDVKSEGSVHDPDSRSSTPSVEGKFRGKDSKRARTGVSPQPVEEPSDMDLDDHGTPLPLASNPRLATTPVDFQSQPTKVLNVEPQLTTTLPDKPTSRIRLSDIQYNKEQALSNPENAALHIPHILHNWIVDDWDQITRLTRLVNLPASLTVINILDRYSKYKCDQSEDYESIQSDVMYIEELFCTCLGNFLLHKWERPQYADLLESNPGVRVSNLYGSHHFLRLFVKMSQVLSMLPAASMGGLATAFNDIINFLEKNEKEFFSISNFGIATPEYHRRAI